MNVKIFTARQPIFNRSKKVVAYELLYRESSKNCFPVGVPGDVATSKLLVNTMLNMDIDDVTDSRPALINFPENILKSALSDLVPSKKIIIEILETVKPDDTTYDRIKKLYHKGYYIALDDFVYQPEWERFFPFVKMVKIDIMETPVGKQVKLIKDLKKRGIKILAEKVETYDDYKKCRAAGFDYFQGFFFCKPEMIHSTGTDVAKHVLVQIYHEVMKDEPNFRLVKRLFSQEPKLSYKLLRYIKKLSGKDIDSISHGVSYLGLENLRKLTSLLITAELSPGKPHELVKFSVVRSRFCEMVAINSKYSKLREQAFMTGLFSTMDAILDRNMGELLQGLPLSNSVKSALLKHQSNELGLILSLAISYEKGEWDIVELQARALGITKGKIAACYNKAMEWEAIMWDKEEQSKKKSKKVA